MRTAQSLGIRTVAVFSDVDADSQHVKMSDEAVNIGPAAAADSYLRGDKILAAAAATGAEAIHPGYGFLSENYDFCKACEDAGVVFIGPPPKAILDMGSKSASKNIMLAAGVPCTPGYHGDDQSFETLKAEADKMGYPLMIKAVLGGGGKGMRIVESADEFSDMLDSARREAMKSFSDDNVLLEKYVRKSRHIEFQIFADHNGEAVHLFERDCSVQRRHQKVLEEAPAPMLDEDLRNRMGDAAVAAAKAVGYVGAGTVEFLFDDITNEFYFMEMNTRLQVEHPVTELVTGVDLVKMQLDVAAGRPLPMAQEDITLTGCAVEARIYAENPYNQFLPATGHLAHLQIPTSEMFTLTDDNVRVDSGIVAGDDISIYYDPMISKLITYAADRPTALALMDKAIAEYEVVGVPNNLDFVQRCIRHPDFAAGGVGTDFLEKYGEALTVPPPAPNDEVLALASLAVYLQRAEGGATLTASDGSEVELAAPGEGPWGGGAARLFGSCNTKVEFSDTGREQEGEDGKTGIPMSIHRDGSVSFDIDGSALTADAGSQFDPSSGKLAARINGVKHECTVVFEGDTVHLFGADENRQMHSVQVVTDKAGASAGVSESTVNSPMPGKIVKILASQGSVVKKGEPLLILEAMKMEHTLNAPCDGTVKEVYFGEGDLVVDGQTLVDLE
jgi:3-methylcrotonyl-CoA carboxylase alpha subunit